MDIRYLKHPDIDKVAWDRCISQADNSRIYARSWYLDISSPNWHALVGDDYEAVFPLPWNAKIPGFSQVFQPWFSQQLGLFTKDLSSEIMEAFLNAIPKRFKKISLSLNEANPTPNFGWKISKRTNYLLNLNINHESLRKNYSKSLRKRIRRAEEKLIFIPDADQLEGFAERYHQNLKDTFELPQQAYDMAAQLLQKAKEKGHGRFFRSTDQKGRLLGEIFLPHDHHRLYYLMGYSNPEGKKQHATHFMLDQIFQLYSNQEMTFDFEGSSIPSIARFFASFGAKETHYHHIERGELPWVIRQLKKLRR
ncbi:MAG: GNAT family N-acetyltransferase [Bacteroidetes bacterium]|nr:GNAT family N-acetyltransferase [Bacteroidota bacterium]